MENDQRATPKPQVPSSTQPFSFGMFLLCMAAAFVVDFLLAMAIPFILFANSGFNIHGPSPAGGPLIYWVANLAVLAYATSKEREVIFGCFSGALLATLVMWPLIS
ncbi:MAG: hypothetical protein ACRYFZ_11105 [Janthinobacterium lividum]